jgi:hypothetical protein
MTNDEFVAELQRLQLALMAAKADRAQRRAREAKADADRAEAVLQHVREQIAEDGFGEVN